MDTATFSYLRKLFLALALILLVAGCAAPPSALMLVPVTGSEPGKPGFEINEYPLVEQSFDNPTHAGFQDRVPQAVNTIRSSWRFPRFGSPIQETNQAMAAFGFHLEGNPVPPFSGYALYQGEIEVQRDIARFWPVLLKDDSSAQARNFLLAFETMTGERMVASSNGIEPWPGQEQADVKSTPVLYQDRIAYAQTGSGEISLLAEGYGLPASSVEGFYQQTIQGQPLYFFTQDSLTYLSFAGEVQPIYYDQVVHDGQDEASLFNPGSNDRLIWFYALRDGLWYYVEAGFSE